MDRCDHDLPLDPPGQCALCSSAARAEQVGITAGGSVYHRFRDCDALRDGWRKVDRRGGVRSDLKWVSKGSIDPRLGLCEACAARS